MDGNKVLTWCKDHKALVKAFIVMWVPLLCCMMTCALEGRTIGEVYLPASEWNDELFYFKQVEGILYNGFPQGYFGFNEINYCLMYVIIFISSIFYSYTF